MEDDSIRDEKVRIDILLTVSTGLLTLAAHIAKVHTSREA